jgi:hypothetical protein
MEHQLDHRQLSEGWNQGRLEPRITRIGTDQEDGFSRSAPIVAIRGEIPDVTSGAP